MLNLCADVAVYDVVPFKLFKEEINVPMSRLNINAWKMRLRKLESLYLQCNGRRGVDCQLFILSPIFFMLG